MQQILHDQVMINKKISGIFEVYEAPEIDTVIALIEEALIDNSIVNDHVEYRKYLSHIYGRQRCIGMRNLTRAELFKAGDLYNQSQLEAYKDIQALFKTVGGLIE